MVATSPPLTSQWKVSVSARTSRAMAVKVRVAPWRTEMGVGDSSVPVGDWRTGGTLVIVTVTTAPFWYATSPVKVSRMLAGPLSGV